jgi:hypothetical protein
VLESLHLAVLRVCQIDEFFGQNLDLVIVAFPGLERGSHTFKDFARFGYGNINSSVFRNVSGVGLPSEMKSDELGPDTNAKYWKIGAVKVFSSIAKLHGLGAYPWSAARKDQPVNIQVLEFCGIGNDIGFYIQVPENPPFAVSPLTPIVHDVYAHVEAEATLVFNLF